MNDALVSVAAVVDPFTPVHGYTGILPIQPLEVPPWLLESAMKQMTAFFSMGPLILTKPLPAFDSGYVLQADDPASKTVPGSENAVNIPAVAAGSSARTSAGSSTRYVWGSAVLT